MAFYCSTSTKKKGYEELKELYPNNYEDHIKNMNDISEKGLIDFPLGKNFIYNWGDGEENILESLMESFTLNIVKNILL